jgi:hypothetical protein
MREIPVPSFSRRRDRGKKIGKRIEKREEYGREENEGKREKG